MILASLWQWLETSAVGSFIAESAWAFPTLESIHVIALVTVVGTIAITDLRLLGLASRKVAVTIVSKETLPFVWGAFILAATTGLLLFTSKASSYAVNPYFQLKMLFLAIAGLNMAVFHVFTWRSVHLWDNEPVIPTAARIAGGTSLLFWIMVVFFGRVIGFTLGIYQ
jgi:hypothetical protein